MAKRSFLLALVGATLTAFSASVDAHYLWVVVNPEDPKQPANIYFEESAKPGDGHYLDHFLGTSQVWIRTTDDPAPDSGKATEVTKGKNRWMQVARPSASEFSVDCYGKFGVYAYGQKNVLLHYYARNLLVSSHDAVHELGRAEQMDLDLVPHNYADKLDITLHWKGKPVSGRRVFVRGPSGFRKNVTTDAEGRIELKALKAGEYSFRSSVEEDVAGSENGEAYEQIRHNITLICQIPLED